ncbi:MAG: beta-propeller fold lactonase family protein [Chitinophagaceae bacterium]|nr:beta-propeller fold lactonase family protein [Chitinophagaceae bacterium]
MRLTFSVGFLLLVQSLIAQVVPSVREEHYFVVGTYDSPKSEGIYVYKFNSADGSAEKISFVKTPNPSFVTVSPDGQFVYAVSETAPQDGKGGDIAAFSFNKQREFLHLSTGNFPVATIPVMWKLIKPENGYLLPTIAAEL